MKKKKWTILGTVAMIGLAVGMEAMAGNPICRLVLGFTFCPDGLGW